MPLSDQQINTLWKAVMGYDFPPCTFDFALGQRVQQNSMLDVENVIRAQLLADDMAQVRDGLSNVLYWGYARIGYRDTRVGLFRDGVLADDRRLRAASDLFRNVHGPAVRAIKKLRLPQFSGLSFVSKVRMFLEPANYVVLDKKLLSLRDQVVPTVFCDIRPTTAITTISITKSNELVYEQWSGQCRSIAARYFPESDMRAVDIERGVFHLIDQNQADAAARILFDA